MLHFDTGKIINHETTPEGYLRCYGKIARTGELRYLNSDGTERIEVVTRDVLFDKKSIDSFKMKVVTNDHPPVKLDSSNSKSYMAGMTSNLAVVDGDFLGIAMTITDSQTIDDIISGRKRQISCGYETELEKREDGKFYQIHRTGNHVAIVEKGRAGSNIKIHLDSWHHELEDLDELVEDKNSNNNLDRFGSENVPEKRIGFDQTLMQKFTLDGFEFETENLDLAKHAKSVDSTLAQYKESLNSQKERADSFSTEVSELKSKLAALEGSNEALKADFERLNTDKADLQEKLKAVEKASLVEDEIANAVQARLDMWNLVLPAFRADNADYKPDFKKTPIQVKTEFVQLRYPNMKLDGRDSNFIDGMFEVAISTKPEISDSNSAGKVDSVLGQIHAERQDSGDSGLRKEQHSYVADLESAWKTL